MIATPPGPGAPPRDPASPSGRPYRILALDGGGVRGILTAGFLAELEGWLNEGVAPADRRPIGDFFDMTVGTSTGAILALGSHLADPADPTRFRYDAQDLIDFYVRDAIRIFPRARRRGRDALGGVPGLFGRATYDGQVLRDVLREAMGEVRLDELRAPAFVTAYDLTRQAAAFFHSHPIEGSPHDNLGPTPYSPRAFEAAAASSSAPTYHPPVALRDHRGREGAFMDGGLVAGNPAMCAYADALVRLRHGDERARLGLPPLEPGEIPRSSAMVLLSVGTGLGLAGDTLEAATRRLNLAWAVPALDMLMHGQIGTADFQLRQIFATGTGTYLRANVSGLSPDVYDLDDAEPAHLEQLETLGRELFPVWLGERSEAEIAVLRGL